MDGLYLLLKSWCSDGFYDPKTLETCLKEHLGTEIALLGPNALEKAIKVGVTAATIGKSEPILLVNYNGQGDVDESCGKLVFFWP